MPFSVGEVHIYIPYGARPPCQVVGVKVPTEPIASIWTLEDCYDEKANRNDGHRLLYYQSMTSL
jgi:hypothetical protein